MQTLPAYMEKHKEEHTPQKVKKLQEQLTKPLKP